MRKSFESTENATNTEILDAWKLALFTKFTPNSTYACANDIVTEGMNSLLKGIITVPVRWEQVQKVSKSLGILSLLNSRANEVLQIKSFASKPPVLQLPQNYHFKLKQLICQTYLDQQGNLIPTKYDELLYINDQHQAHQTSFQIVENWIDFDLAHWKLEVQQCCVRKYTTEEIQQLPQDSDDNANPFEEDDDEAILSNWQQQPPEELETTQNELENVQSQQDSGGLTPTLPSDEFEDSEEYKLKLTKLKRNSEHIQEQSTPQNSSSTITKKSKRQKKTRFLEGYVDEDGFDMSEPRQF